MHSGKRFDRLEEDDVMIAIEAGAKVGCKDVVKCWC